MTAFPRILGLGLVAASVIWMGWRHGGATLPVSSTPTIALVPAQDRAAQADFSYVDAAGSHHTLRESWEHGPVLVHFWATWCGPCVTELPSLEHLAQDHGDTVRILPLSLDRNAISVAQSFLAQRHLDHLPALAPDADAPSPTELPYSILVDQNGKIAWTHAGTYPWDGAAILQAITSLSRPN